MIFLVNNDDIDYDGEFVYQILFADCHPLVFEEDMKEKSGKEAMDWR